MGTPFATEGLSPEQLATPLGILDINHNLVRRLGNANIHKVEEFLNTPAKHLRFVYRVGAGSFDEALTAIINAGLSPKIPEAHRGPAILRLIGH